MKTLPLAITTFSEIRNRDHLYVDKTEQIHQLTESGKYYFLSRPRRFGKTLLLDTMSSLFQSEKELFAGLYIYQRWDWKNSYPVITIDLNRGDFSSGEKITKSIITILKHNQKSLDISCEEREDIPGCFNEIIERAYEKHQQQVVILIDEYDKPILDNITNRELATEARTILKSLYSTIKSNDRYLKFVFLTGVSKFSKMNLFSGLNNLMDITINPDYATICGYTHQDIKTTFGEHLKDVDLEELKEWYNGYNYLGDPVYNPYDILLFIANSHEYANYWWGTGNPGFLIEKLKAQNYNIPQLEEIEVTAEILDTFDIEKIDLIALLWQTGYITFKERVKRYNQTLYRMQIPNREIEISLNTLFIQYLTDQTVEVIKNKDKIYNAITDNMADLKQALTTLFSGIPYNNYANNIIANYEGYYASVIYTYIKSLGYPCIAEDVTNKGRIDLTVQLPERIIIIEFKVDQKEQALKQIREKKYYQKYQHENRELYIVGICFNSIERNVSEFEWEKLTPKS